MSIPLRAPGLASLAVVSILGGLLPDPGTVAAGGGPGLPQDPRAPRTALPVRAGEDFGMDGCVVCHDRQQALILAGVHRDVVAPGSRGCETCHGPGAAHGEDLDNDPRLITHPPSLAPAAQFRFCGRCHQEQLTGHGGDPAGFVQAGKGCTACHEVHAAPPAPAHEGIRMRNRADAATLAEPVGAAACRSCHPLRHQLLARSAHAILAADETGCERCHGAGSLHVETQGVARLITRPDRARDGARTCLGCHREVDPVDFHWAGRHKPLLTADATCTTCHTVHRPEPHTRAQDGSRAGPDPETGEHPWEFFERGQDPLPEPGQAGQPPTNRLCMRCHEPAFGVLPGTVHESLGRPGTPLEQGCGACHAGAGQHAGTAGRRDLVRSLHGSSAAVQLETCGACHQQDPALRHVRAGSHHRSEISCLSCHSPAAPKGQVRQDAEQKCQSCHQTVAAQFRQPNHHPVPEGHMGCADCHDPHGARFRFRDLELRQGRCVSCHREYRGPFVFAHQASRIDGCVICHAPHGSSNRRMLLQANSQQNCLQCHGDFPAFHDQTTGSVFTNCLNCHTEVHGSNHSRLLLR